MCDSATILVESSNVRLSFQSEAIVRSHQSCHTTNEKISYHSFAITNASFYVCWTAWTGVTAQLWPSDLARRGGEQKSEQWRWAKTKGWNQRRVCSPWPNGTLYVSAWLRRPNLRNRLILVMWLWDGDLAFRCGSWRMQCLWSAAADVAPQIDNLREGQ